MTITCKYSCSLCGLHRISVEVLARKDEDVGEWLMGIAAVALAQDHEKRSPHCYPQTFSEVMIPISGADKIGGPAVN